MESPVCMFQTLLERKIEERGYTQPEIEQTQGWEEGTIARLLAEEDELRVKQVLAILGAVGVEPEAFFAELYGLTTGKLLVEFAELKALVGSVVNLLVEKDAVTAADLVNAVAAQARTPR